MYAVILAGGGGTRLWPVSTPQRPKPFLPLLGDRTLLQMTADRLAGLVADDAIYVVTDRRYADLVRAQLPAATVVAEPMGRNTAAAIALAAVAIERRDEEVMAVLPADHAIAREDVFRSVLAAADVELARGAFEHPSPLVTLGIEVSRPATEYGYLIPDLERRSDRGLTAFPLVSFEEKPTPTRAAELMATQGVAWNAGMFLWRREVITAALGRYAPDILDEVEEAWRAATLDEAYQSIRSTSIDYAVMEPAARAGQVVMGAMDVGWTDLGSWSALLADLGAGDVDGRIVQAGESAEIGLSDLGVVRRDGRLAILAGPGTIADEPGPSALLEGAAPRRAVIDALVARVTAAER
ncbi:MAG: mannose-1-phosphate guanylyltransferase [Candidatus Limnocylindrales bacterium]